MQSNVTALERAFQLAKTGQYLDVSQIRQRLRFEGYDQGQVEGRSLLLQLRDIIRVSAQKP